MGCRDCLWSFWASVGGICTALAHLPIQPFQADSYALEQHTAMSMAHPIPVNSDFLANCQSTRKLVDHATEYIPAPALHTAAIMAIEVI